MIDKGRGGYPRGDWLSDASQELRRIENPNMAKTTYNRIAQAIDDFQTALGPKDEVGALLAMFGREVLIHIHDIGFYNPQLIVFYGQTQDGNKVRLVQHQSQVNILLMAVRPLEGQEPRRLGFDLDDDGSQSATQE